MALPGKSTPYRVPEPEPIQQPEPERHIVVEPFPDFAPSEPEPVTVPEEEPEKVPA